MRRTRVQGRETRDGIGERGGRRNARNPRRVRRRDLENGGYLGGPFKKTVSRQESVGSVGAYQGYLAMSDEAEREAQGSKGLDKNCRECLSSLIRDFRTK